MLGKWLVGLLLTVSTAVGGASGGHQGGRRARGNRHDGGKHNSTSSTLLADDSGRIVEDFVLNYHIGETNASLSWNVDWGAQTLNFALRFEHVIAPKSFMLGFSDHGLIEDGFDTCSGNVHKLYYDQEKVIDGYVEFVNSTAQVGKDLHQDCVLKNVVLSDNNSMTVYFDRKFITCDPRDFAFETGTTNIFLFVDPEEHGYNFTDMPSQLRSAVLLRPSQSVEPPKSADPNAKTGSKRWYLDLKMDNAKISSNSTTYWSKTFKLDKFYEENLSYVLQSEVVLSPETKHLVHHAFLYACMGPVEYDGYATAPGSEVLKQCDTALLGWAMGVGPITFPKDTGYPVGPGHTFTPNVMVEIHYHNIDHQSGLLDNSGFRLLFTTEKQKHNIGILQSGLAVSDANAMPPGQKDWALTGHCRAPCTDNFPTDGIHIFGSVLHMHLAGRRIYTTHYRNGQKMGEIDRDNHFYAHWQRFTTFEKHIHVMPGDTLSTTCVYDTRHRTNWTFGGFGTNDEMCLDLLWYYPAVPIALCQTVADNATLAEFFARNGLEEKHQDLKLHERFEKLEWNQQKVDNLRELYYVGEQKVHCYSPTGAELKEKTGKGWEHIPRQEPQSAVYERVISRDSCPSMNNY